MVSEIAKLAVINCTKMKDTACDKCQEWNYAYAKLTLKRVQNPKVQMEELQWGFPIATPLSLNKPHINKWEVKERLRMACPLFSEGDEGVGLRALSKSGGG
jgi:hypothetical protein